MPASFLFVCVYARLASTSALILLLLLLQSFGFSVCGLKASVLFAWLLPSLVEFQKARRLVETSNLAGLVDFRVAPSCPRADVMGVM